VKLAECGSPEATPGLPATNQPNRKEAYESTRPLDCVEDRPLLEQQGLAVAAHDVEILGCNTPPPVSLSLSSTAQRAQLVHKS